METEKQLADFRGAVDVLHVENGAEAEEEDLGEGGDELRLGDDHIDAVGARTQRRQTLQGQAQPSL